MLKKIVSILFLVVLLAACAGNSAPSTAITIELTDFAYSSLSVTIPAGQPVLITLENKGLVEHDFVIKKIEADVVLKQDSGSEAHSAHGEVSNFDVHASAQTGETTVIELTISEPGTYQFFCSVAGHKEAGMIGELIVVAAEQ
jgi:uncharacterized cupredoxin-like copper-binding protein